MKQELYIVSLPDYSVSPIISGATKEYIGTKEDIADVIQDGEVVIAKQGVVLSETTYYYTGIKNHLQCRWNGRTLVSE